MQEVQPTYFFNNNQNNPITRFETASNHLLDHYIQDRSHSPCLDTIILQITNMAQMISFEPDRLIFFVQKNQLSYAFHRDVTPFSDGSVEAYPLMIQPIKDSILQNALLEILFLQIQAYENKTSEEFNEIYIEDMHALKSYQDDQEEVTSEEMSSFN